MSYTTSLEEVLWGTALVAITMAIHGFGMLLTLFICHSLKRDTDRAQSFLRGVSVLILASWMIVLVHLVELLVWAAFFLWQEAMPNASVSYYFSLLQYTTVGSAYNLPFRWRLLEGLLPIAGLLTFAWSTGVLFTLAQEFQSRQLTAILERRQAHRARQQARRPEPVDRV